MEPTIHVPIELSRILASDTLHHRRSRRVVNKALYRSIPHPWGEGTSRKEWERRLVDYSVYIPPMVYYTVVHLGVLYSYCETGEWSCSAGLKMI